MNVVKRMIAVVAIVIVLPLQAADVQIREDEQIWATRYVRVISPAQQRRTQTIRGQKKAHVNARPAEPVDYVASVLALSDDEASVITAGGAPDGVVQCWDMQGNLRWEFTDFAAGGAAAFAHFLDNENLLVGSKDCTIRVLRVADGKQLTRTGTPLKAKVIPTGALDRPQPIGFSLAPNKKWGALLLADGWLYQLDLRSIREPGHDAATFKERMMPNGRQDLLAMHGTPAALSISPDGQHMMVVCGRREVIILNVRDWSQEARFLLPDPLTYASFRPGVKDLQAVCLGGNVAQLWQLTTTVDPPRQRDTSVRDLSGYQRITVSPDRVGETLERLQRNQQSGVARYIQDEWNRGTFIREFKAPGLEHAHPQGETIGLVFLPHGELVLTVGLIINEKETKAAGAPTARTRLCLWRAESGQLLDSQVVDYAVMNIRFMADGESFLASCNDKKVRIFHVPTPQQVALALQAEQFVPVAAQE